MKFALAVTGSLLVTSQCIPSATVFAQPQQEVIEDLPDPRVLAAALSEPALRNEALLTLIAVSRALQDGAVAESGQVGDLAAVIRDNRAWLDQLAARYSRPLSRSTVLDPAAWFIQQELGQHDIVPSLPVSPLGPGYEEILVHLFDRTDVPLAAAYLPEALFQAEFMSTTTWTQLLAQVTANSNLRQVFAGLSADWFEPWLAVVPPQPLGSDGQSGLLEASLVSLQTLMASVVSPQARDDELIKRLRFTLLEAMPGLDQDQARTARYTLRLVSAIQDLDDGRLLGFVESLLWVVTDLLDVYRRDPDAWSPVAGIMQEFLPALSNAMARDFAEADSRFNTTLAAAFDVVQTLGGGSLTQASYARLQQELADAVAQVVLLVPEMSVYFDQPVRKRISAEIDVCISVAAVHDENGKPVLTRKQFDACIASMAKLADTLVRRAELAGDPRGPFADEQLRREFDMAPWQRINYTLGYLHEREPTACAMPVRPLPNPLEWSVLATLMTWFSSQSPVYFQTPENEKLINGMRQQGLDLLRIMSQQVECINAASSRFNDLVSASMQQYRGALIDLIDGVHEAELEFNSTHLREGADIDLGAGVQQETAYRTPGISIGPCDPARVCEMTQTLEATRALVGQFPEVYLIADQTGLGKLEICYDNMQWVERRTDLVRPEDPNVANFYGHLSFDLVGRYRQGQMVSNVFGSNFISPDEYHYLVAANKPEVLDDGCPSEWIGDRIVTKRTEKDDFDIVPNRLTYLAAARSRPSEVIGANWDRGAEWRDWFVTGIGVKEIEFSPDPSIDDQVGQHLRGLYMAEQRAIYGQLSGAQEATSVSAITALPELVKAVSMNKGLLRNQLVLFYPEKLLDSDAIRMAMQGQGGLLDETLLQRFRDNGVAISQIRDSGLARLEQLQSAWKSQPEATIRSGSVSISLAHAMARLNALYREYFATLPQAPAAPVNAVDEGDGSSSPSQ